MPVPVPEQGLAWRQAQLLVAQVLRHALEMRLAQRCLQTRKVAELFLA